VLKPGIKQIVISSAYIYKVSASAGVNSARSPQN
jgi:hypothetical protein